jgi:hypothetical protein
MNNLQMAKQINQEYQQYQEQEVLHNQEMHQRILATWRRDSPKMTAELTKLKLMDKMAFVVQERMWLASAENLKAGMPVTDAREQAEREHLLLEPELED